MNDVTQGGNKSTKGLLHTSLTEEEGVRKFKSLHYVIRNDPLDQFSQYFLG